MSAVGLCENCDEAPIVNDQRSVMNTNSKKIKLLQENLVTSFFSSIIYFFKQTFEEFFLPQFGFGEENKL